MTIKINMPTITPEKNIFIVKGIFIFIIDEKNININVSKTTNISFNVNLFII